MADEVDFSELTALTRELERATPKAMVNVRKAVEITSRHIKDDWKKRAARKGLRHYASSIDYTVRRSAAFGGATVEGEIGPNLSRRRSGAAFGLVEEGGSGVKSRPQHAGRDALKAAEPDFLKGLEIALAEAMPS